MCTICNYFAEPFPQLKVKKMDFRKGGIYLGFFENCPPGAVGSNLIWGYIFFPSLWCPKKFSKILVHMLSLWTYFGFDSKGLKISKTAHFWSFLNEFLTPLSEGSKENSVNFWYMGNCIKQTFGPI